MDGCRAIGRAGAPGREGTGASGLVEGGGRALARTRGREELERGEIFVTRL
jgi:hypothetical protein